MSFDNVCLSELSNIEDKLEINVHIFGCNKDFKSKKLLENLKKHLIKI